MGTRFQNYMWKKVHTQGCPDLISLVWAFTSNQAPVCILGTAQISAHSDWKSLTCAWLCIATARWDHGNQWIRLVTLCTLLHFRFCTLSAQVNGRKMQGNVPGKGSSTARESERIKQASDVLVYSKKGGKSHTHLFKGGRRILRQMSGGRAARLLNQGISNPK